MTEAVQLAFLAMVHEWGHDLITNMTAVVAGVLAFATFVMQAWSKWSDRKDRINAERARMKADADRAALQKSSDDTALLAKAAAMTKDHIDLMAKGAERAGVEKGIEIERKRSSGFNPLTTDVVDVSKP